MSGFLISIRQAFRRTDTSRTQTESLAAVDVPDTAGTHRALPSYEDALEQVGADSPVVTEISDEYDRLIDVYDPEFYGGRELPSWQDYFVETLDVWRACGYFDDETTPAHVHDASADENSADDADTHDIDWKYEQGEAEYIHGLEHEEAVVLDQFRNEHPEADLSTLEVGNGTEEANEKEDEYAVSGWPTEYRSVPNASSYRNSLSYAYPVAEAEAEDVADDADGYPA